MSNIFHELKRGFLILGFAGPLSSGCTSAARFFEKDINTYIQKRCGKRLSTLEYDIKNKYKKFKELKDTLKSTGNKSELHREINKLANQIPEMLNLRETLTILNEYKENNFKYISMTDMLLKLTIEALWYEPEKNLSGSLLKLKQAIYYDKNKFAKAQEINIQIKKRELSDLKEADIDIYENYLEYITDYRSKLTSIFDASELATLMQDLGDNARKCGRPIDDKSPFKKENAKTLFILAEEANNLIKFYRNRKRESFGKVVYKEFAIEAFRNPYEVEYFRNRYYEFYLFSIYAPLRIRQRRGNYDGLRDQRDRGQHLGDMDFNKQNVSKCVHLSDIAINNDSEKKYVFERKLAKYFALICRPGCIAPSDDELFMQQAYCMSVKSNCISRQVGAIIVGKRKYIVGAGWNDVGEGQVPCGFRRYSDIEGGDKPFPIAIKGEENDFAQFLKESGKKFPSHDFCFKDEYSKFKTINKIEKLCKSNFTLNEWQLKHSVSQDGMKSLSDLVADNFAVKRLEYCRALHAEENALLQNSIIGGVGIEGATMYTTTFPCELCAKKIYQARLRKVVYTEPYPESISEDVFFKDGSHSIELIQFEGVKSHSYYRLYKSPIDKKEFQNQERLY